MIFTLIEGMKAWNGLVIVARTIASLPTPCRLTAKKIAGFSNKIGSHCDRLADALPDHF